MENYSKLHDEAVWSVKISLSCNYKTKDLTLSNVPSFQSGTILRY